MGDQGWVELSTCLEVIFIFLENIIGSNLNVNKTTFGENYA